jgi:hypothetical protein
VTVYIVQEVLSDDRPIHDTTSAEEFGERRVLYRTTGYSKEVVDDRGIHRRARPFHVNADRDKDAVEVIKDKMAGYGLGDYLVPIGSIKLTAIAAALAAHATGGRLDLLMWDHKAQRYEPTSVQLWSVDDLWQRSLVPEEENADAP